jgi:hypothetical protein
LDETVENFLLREVARRAVLFLATDPGIAPEIVKDYPLAIVALDPETLAS